MAGEAVGEMRDGERVGFGLIVGIDRVEVAEDEEARPLRPGRQEQAGLLYATGAPADSRAPSARRTLALRPARQGCFVPAARRPVIAGAVP